MTDSETMEFLISIAEISGVFVAFGVLIGAVQSRDTVAPEKRALAQAVSMIGIVSLLGAGQVEFYMMWECHADRVCSSPTAVLAWLLECHAGCIACVSPLAWWLECWAEAELGRG